MKNTQSPPSLVSLASRLVASISALWVLDPAAHGQEPPSRPEEQPAAEKADDSVAMKVTQFDKLVGKAETLQKAGDMSGACDLCREALVLAALDKATMDLLAALDVVLWRLGRVADQAGDLRVAKAAFEGVHRYREAALPDHHPALQEARNGLASTKFALGDLAGALELQEKVLAVRSMTLPDDHPDLQKVRNNLSNTRFALGDLQGALELDEKVLAVRSATLPDDHPDLQKIRSNLAATKFELGDLPGALALQEKVLAGFSAKLPDDHPDLQAARNNLAGTKSALGDLPGALTLQEQVLAAFSARLPHDHPNLQKARNNLANTRFELGDLWGALVLQEKVLAIRLATLPDDHPDLQASRGNLASTRSALGDLPGAMALEEKVLAVLSATLPDDHPDLQVARGNLSGSKSVLGDLPGALALQEKVLAVSSATLPDHHPDLQWARGNLARTMRALGDLKGALALQAEVLEVLSQTLPDNHPNLQTERTSFASTKFDSGDLQGALTLQEQVLVVLSATLADHHPSLLAVRSNLARTRSALGDLPAAQALQEQVLAVCLSTLPGGHPSLQAAHGDLAATKHALGDLATAAQLLHALIAGAVNRLSAQTASLRDIVQVARHAAEPLSRVASILDLGQLLSGEIAVRLRIDGLYLLEATRSAPVHLSRLRQFVRTQHPETSARLLPQLVLANRRLDEAVALDTEGRRGPDGKQVSRDDSIREAALAKDRIEREWLALIPADARASPDVATLAKALAKDQVAISFCAYTRWSNDREKPWISTSQERYGAFVLTPHGGVAWHSLATTAEVDALVADIRQLATASRQPKIIESRLAELRALILDPVLASVPVGTKSLVLSLADGMHLVPLDEIKLASGKLLGDAFSVQSVWSLRALLEAPRDRSVEPTALVVGCPDYDTHPDGGAPIPPVGSMPTVDPVARADASALDASSGKDHRSVPKVFHSLPQTRREAETLLTIFRSSFGDRPIATLLAVAASKASVAAQATGKGYLHFATHGYFAPELALQAVDRGEPGPTARFDIGQGDRVAQLSPYSLTGIALAGANLPVNALGQRQGILTAQEITQLDLSACYLATLSACESSLGVRQAGSGLASLRQSFHAAGARYVLATLWKVDDQIAADLMADFYARVWQQREDPHAALRAAKARANKRGAPFRDWAGWVLTGR